MMKKYTVLICLVISVFLIVIAALQYPGGSPNDINFSGFDWADNFISNLFEGQSINGNKNVSRPWALAGILFHAIGYGFFFMNMAKKMPTKHAGIVLEIVGLVNIFFTILIATPFHDEMVNLSSTLFLIGLFYITVYTFKTQLTFFKFACSICLVIFYYSLYLYGSGDWNLLAIMQKITFLSSMILIIGLEYFTTKADYRSVVKE